MSEHPDCTCETEDIEPHTCPYTDEMCITKEERDEQGLCQCCSYCTGQCAMDI